MKARRRSSGHDLEITGLGAGSRRSSLASQQDYTAGYNVLTESRSEVFSNQVREIIESGPAMEPKDALNDESPWWERAKSKNHVHGVEGGRLSADSLSSQFRKGQLTGPKGSPDGTREGRGVVEHDEVAHDIVEGAIQRTSTQPLPEEIGGHVKRRCMLQMFRETNATVRLPMHAALIFQTFWRGHLGRKVEPLAYYLRCRRRRCVVKAQAFVRGWLGRKRAKVMLSEAAGRHVYAAKIQAVIRGVLARKRVAALQRATLAIQGAYRRHRSSLNCRRESVAAVRIQALFRGHVTRKQLRLSRQPAYSEEEQDLAATVIQLCFLEYVSRRDRKRSQAAIRIQAAVRAALARRERARLAAERIAKAEAEDAAAQTIQHAFRTLRLRRQQGSRVVALQNEAIVKMQAVVRGHRARRLSSQLREEVTQAATSIQAIYRGSRVRRRSAAETHAAVVLQAAVRGRQSRRRFSMMLEEERQYLAASRVQAAFRGFIARKQVRARLAARQRVGMAALKIQASFRGTIARKTYRELLRKHSSVRVLQRTWRVRQEALRQRDLAALTIQGAWRKVLRERKTLIAQHTAASRIQLAWKAYCAHRREDEEPLAGVYACPESWVVGVKSPPRSVSRPASTRTSRATSAAGSSRSPVDVLPSARSGTASASDAGAGSRPPSRMSLASATSGDPGLARPTHVPIRKLSRPFPAPLPRQHVPSGIPRPSPPSSARQDSDAHDHAIVRAARVSFAAKRVQRWWRLQSHKCKHFRAAKRIQASWRGYAARQFATLLRARMQLDSKIAALENELGVVTWEEAVTPAAQSAHPSASVSVDRADPYDDGAGVISRPDATKRVHSILPHHPGSHDLHACGGPVAAVSDSKMRKDRRRIRQSLSVSVTDQEAEHPQPLKQSPTHGHTSATSATEGDVGTSGAVPIRQRRSSSANESAHSHSPSTPTAVAAVAVAAEKLATRRTRHVDVKPSMSNHSTQTKAVTRPRPTPGKPKKNPEAATHKQSNSPGPRPPRRRTRERSVSMSEGLSISQPVRRPPGVAPLPDPTEKRRGIAVAWAVKPGATTKLAPLRTPPQPQAVGKENVGKPASLSQRRPHSDGDVLGNLGSKTRRSDRTSGNLSAVSLRPINQNTEPAEEFWDSRDIFNTNPKAAAYNRTTAMRFGQKRVVPAASAAAPSLAQERGRKLVRDKPPSPRFEHTKGIFSGSTTPLSRSPVSSREGDRYRGKAGGVRAAVRDLPLGADAASTAASGFFHDTEIRDVDGDASPTWGRPGQVQVRRDVASLTYRRAQELAQQQRENDTNKLFRAVARLGSC